MSTTFMRNTRSTDLTIRLVFQGDYEIIKKTMSIMLLLTLLHTFILFPILTVDSKLVIDA